MGLYKFRPPLSGRMGTLRTLGTIRDAALIEYGCMGHMLYGRVFLNQAGVADGCRLYSTHIDETDISMGDTGRLDRSIAHIVQRDNPKIIFLLPSSVPSVIGTDLTAICRELQPDYPDVKLLPFGYGGFDVHGYRGVEEALLLLAKKLPLEQSRTLKPTFNILGSCADMYRFLADSQELIRVMEGAFDMKPICVMTSDTSVEQLESMGSAHVNLVIRREALKAAKHLEKRFKTPYLTGRPYGIEGTAAWIRELAEVTGIEPNKEFVQKEINSAKAHIRPAKPVFNHMIRSHSEEAAVSLGGHVDVVKGVMKYAVNELALHKGDCWCDSQDMAEEELPYYSEDQWSSAIANRKKGLLMASGEALRWANRREELQISNPDLRWRLNPYESPFVGFRGAVHLADLWLNALLEQEGDS